jgi:multidrug resistance efflux pump
VTGFTNTEEEGVGLTNIVPFLVEDMLKANGGSMKKARIGVPYVVVDGRLVTGQNPASSEAAAKELLKLLKPARNGALIVAVVVVFAVLPPGEVRGEVMGTGTLEARVKTTISPRIQERLAEVLVDQGDPVKSGQLLARLDDAETKQQVAIAEASLAAARATVERVRADEARAQAVLQQAQLDHQRVADLIATKVAAQSDFDKAVESLRVAEADLKRHRR